MVSRTRSISTSSIPFNSDGKQSSETRLPGANSEWRSTTTRAYGVPGSIMVLVRSLNLTRRSATVYLLSLGTRQLREAIDEGPYRGRPRRRRAGRWHVPGRGGRAGVQSAVLLGTRQEGRG